MAPARILAKSSTATETLHAELSQHLKDVFESAFQVVHSSGSDQLAAMGLGIEEWQERFRRTVLLAAAIHDLGKANNQFQGMIHGESASQIIRHEWVSVWIANQPKMKDWLLPAVDGCESCWHVAMAAVAGHHPKHLRCSPQSRDFEKASESLEVMTWHEGFKECLIEIQSLLGLANPPTEIDSIVVGGANDHAGPRRFVGMVENGTDDLKEQCRSDQSWKRFCACVKACVVASDVAGSALWEHIETASGRHDWIADTLTRRPSTEQLDSIVANRLGKHQPRKFQTDIADSSADVTLVEAGCGSGKTVAAYMWAAKQHAGRRLWFCYPTTGTASSGFQNYLLEAESNENGKLRVVDGADLFHSRTHYDKLQMLSTSELDERIDDASVRVESLKAWDTKIVACTVDSLLLILQNQRRGLYAWPAISQSAIVFDEVHSYDDILFGNLLTFLQELPGIPVMLMTASLPLARRQAIEKFTTRVNRTFHAIAGPEDLESLSRYQQYADDTSTTVEDAYEMAREEFDNNGRVLWISNTVERTRQVGIELSDCNSIVYHSRFVYKDRVERHNEVTKLFDSDSAGFSSTSQVAEMSLDLKHATLLVTELAPIPALIQRLGRLNRAAHPDQPADKRTPKRFVVIEPRDSRDEIMSLPYTDEDLELARAWLASLGREPLSQSDLVDAWRAIDKTTKVKAVKSGWLTGGMETPVDSIREAGYGVTVIRESDLPNSQADGSVVQYTLPMNYPRADNWRLPFRRAGFPIASDSAIDYCPRTGAVWSTFVII